MFRQGVVKQILIFSESQPSKTNVANDINGDCNIDFVDFQILAYRWLEGK